MSENSERPQRYCTNCGAEIRAGTGFCVSCGVALSATGVLESTRDAPNLASASEEVQLSEAEPRPNEEVSGSSRQDVYREYDLHRRFFEEAHEGLARFSERLRDEADRTGDGDSLSHNDLARALLYAQRGLNKIEQYGPELTTLLDREASQNQAQAALTDLRENQKDVLASLESFYDKLEAAKGWAVYALDFARWYTDSLEHYIYSNWLEKTRKPAPAQSGSSNINSYDDDAKNLTPDPDDPRSSATETSTTNDAPQPSSFPARALTTANRWFRTLQLPQKILLIMLIASTAYMLVLQTRLFLALVLVCGLLTAVAFFWLRGERFRRVAAAIQRHQVVSGVVLLALVCSTPVLVPAMGVFLVLLLNIVIVMVVAAGIIGVGYLVVVGLMKAAEERQAREEAHRRWYNSLSEQEKQTYQLERQSRMMEEQRRIEQAERFAEAMRRMNKRHYR